MRHKSVQELRRLALDVGLLLLGAAVVAAAVLAASQASGRNEPPPPSAVATPSPVPTRDSLAVADPVARLSDGERQWTLGIVGDGTGDEAQEWVYLLAERLSGQKDRPAIVHNWSIESNSYSSVTTIGAGSGAPIVIWNGSGPGVTPGYSVQQFTQLLPEKPDLLIFNHGAEITRAGSADRDMASQIRSSWETWGRGAVAHAAVLQNPRLDDDAQRQEAVVEQVRRWTDALGVTPVDVFGAYSRSEADLLLNGDGGSPSVEGHRLWAAVTAQTLFP